MEIMGYTFKNLRLCDTFVLPDMYSIFLKKYLDCDGMLTVELRFIDSRE